MMLSILIPAYNEQVTVGQAIEDHLKAVEECRGLFDDWELVCLDDASTDETPQILDRLAACHTNVRVIHHEKNQGINTSFHRLFREARGSHIYYTASDGQWPARNLRILLEALLKQKLDLAVGVRANRPEVYGPWRLILSYGFNWIPNVLFGVETGDANSIKLGRRELFTMPLMSKSFFGEVERIVEATRQGFKIGFETIEFLPRKSGKAYGAKWSNVFATARDGVRYAFKYWLRVFRRTP